METTRIHGGTLTFADKGHQYHWNDERVEHTVSGICGDGYPSKFAIAAGWAAKRIRQELLQELTDQDLRAFLSSDDWINEGYEDQEFDDVSHRTSDR